VATAQTHLFLHTGTMRAMADVVDDIAKWEVQLLESVQDCEWCEGKKQMWQGDMLASAFLKEKAGVPVQAIDIQSALDRMCATRSEVVAAAPPPPDVWTVGYVYENPRHLGEQRGHRDDKTSLVFSVRLLRSAVEAGNLDMRLLLGAKTLFGTRTCAVEEIMDCEIQFQDRVKGTTMLDCLQAVHGHGRGWCPGVVLPLHGFACLECHVPSTGTVDAPLEHMENFFLISDPEEYRLTSKEFSATVLPSFPRTLHKFVACEGDVENATAFSPAVWCALGLQMCYTLHVLQQARVVHGDVQVRLK
jgi:hypothetical protein